jgi:dolichol-phosphate mannosyltransferase
MLSVIIPVYNEAKNLPPVYQRLNEVLQKLNVAFEVILINDGSTDDSMKVIKLLAAANTPIRYINLSRNFGHQIAVCAGLDFAKGDKIVIMDADGQDPPEVIEKLYLKSLEGFQVVYARRKSRQGDGLLKKATARCFYRILRKITKIDIPLDTGDFRIIDKKIVEQLRRMPERQKFLRGQISWIGFKQASVEFEREKRLSGATGYTMGKMIRLALDGITSFSNLPLRLATVSGFIFSIVGFLLIVYTLYSRLYTDDYEPGWASQMITIIFIGGIQLIGIGIIGEYISRISDNVRNRPLYIVDETNIH